jgi:predicted nucleic acid-binding protein
MLLDSNVIIYSAQPENEFLRRLIAEKAPAVSAVSYVEVLGYHRLTDTELKYLEALFAKARILPLVQPVLDEAVRLRQATNIDGLRVLNPFAELSSAPPERET